MKQVIYTYALLFYVFIFMYFSNILFINFAKEPKIGIYITAIKEGLKRWRSMGLAFIIVLIGYTVITLILNTILTYTVTFGLILLIIGYLLYFAWSRYYLLEVYERK